jgi:U2-associated protein SR140
MCVSFGTHLDMMFAHLHKAYAAIDGRLRAEQFKSRIMRCFGAWEESQLYPTDVLIRQQNIFLGLVDSVSFAPRSQSLNGVFLQSIVTGITPSEHIHSMRTNEDVGVAKKHAPRQSIRESAHRSMNVKDHDDDYFDDLDGVPLDQDEDDDGDVDGEPRKLFARFIHTRALKKLQLILK